MISQKGLYISDKVTAIPNDQGYTHFYLQHAEEKQVNRVLVLGDKFVFDYFADSGWEDCDINAAEKFVSELNADDDAKVNPANFT